jgi:hypothetical protein
MYRRRIDRSSNALWNGRQGFDSLHNYGPFSLSPPSGRHCSPLSAFSISFRGLITRGQSNGAVNIATTCISEENVQGDYIHFPSHLQDLVLRHGGLLQNRAQWLLKTVHRVYMFDSGRVLSCFEASVSYSDMRTVAWRRSRTICVKACLFVTTSYELVHLRMWYLVWYRWRMFLEVTVEYVLCL